MVEKKSSFKTYQTAYLVAGLTALILLVVVPAIGVPLYNATANTHQELLAKNAELQKEEDRLETLRGLQDKKDTLVAQNQKVLAALPTDTDVARLFVQFENIANQNGMSITSVSQGGAGSTQAESTSAAKPTGTLTPVSYAVSGTTTNYAALKNVLSKIETALRVLSVDKVDVSGSGSNLTVSMTVTTYERGTAQ